MIYNPITEESLRSGLENFSKMSCIEKYSGLYGCISRCVDVTFQKADDNNE
ncbi:hypothetical protein [Candidatus Mesenet endosymbiont of Phosphuga atrata]|uniref:hypothetical protein n=1 Tax=Candidatus Mesenet endosymbiont of Phosphuga atrata TaxID=3066221 RepID=UPI0030D25D24